MEHRRRTSGIRPGSQIPAGNSNQSDGAKAARQALHGHAFRRWKVIPPLLPPPPPPPPAEGFITLFRIIGSSYRFIPRSVAEQYDLDIPDYEGVDQIAEISGNGTESKKEKIVGLVERQA